MGAVWRKRRRKRGLVGTESSRCRLERRAAWEPESSASSLRAANGSTPVAHPPQAPPSDRPRPPLGPAPQLGPALQLQSRKLSFYRGPAPAPWRPRPSPRPRPGRTSASWAAEPAESPRSAACPPAPLFRLPPPPGPSPNCCGLAVPGWRPAGGPPSPR